MNGPFFETIEQRKKERAGRFAKRPYIMENNKRRPFNDEHPRFLSRGILVLIIVCTASVLPAFSRQTFMAALGLPHFGLGYFYAYRAGKLRPARFVLTMGLLFGLLLWTTQSGFPAGLLRVVTLSWFIIHFACDELFLTGRKITQLGRLAFGSLWLVVTASALRNWLSILLGSSLMLVGFLMALVATWMCTLDKKKHVHSGVLEFTVPAMCVALVDYLWRPDLSWTAMIFIGFHYLHWYVAYDHKLRENKSALQFFRRAVVVVNVISMVALMLWGQGGRLGQGLGYLFSPDAFYILTLGHLFYTVRAEDFSLLRRGLKEPILQQRWRLGWCTMGAGCAAGALGALGYAGPSLLPFYIVSMGILAWVALSQASAWRVCLFAVGFTLGQIPAAFLGAVSWGEVLYIQIILAMGMCAVVPMVCWGRMVRAYGGQPHGLMGWMIACLGAMAWGALWQWLPELLGWPVAMSAHFVALPDILAAARWIGVEGLSGLMVAASVMFAFALGTKISLQSVMRGVVAATSVIVFAWILGFTARKSAAPAMSSLSVGIPQINASPTYYASKPSNQPMRIAFQRRVHELLRDLEHVNMLVTPEEFDGVYYAHLPKQLEPWRRRAVGLKQNIVLSAPVQTEEGRQNTMMVLDTTGAVRGTHAKVNLAPSGEIYKAKGAGFSPVVLTQNRSLGLLICIEAGLREGPETLVRKGASLLVTSTDDSSFGGHALTYLHLAMAQLRAASVGRPMVWASNAGPSGVIDRFGRFEKGASLSNASAAQVNVAPASDQTLYMTMGSRTFMLCVLLMLVFSFVLGGRTGSSPCASLMRGQDVLGSHLQYVGFFMGIVVLLSMGTLVQWRHRGVDAALIAFRSPFPPVPMAVFDQPTVDGHLSPSDHRLAASMSLFLEDVGIHRSWKELAEALHGVKSPQDAISYLVNAFGIRTTSMSINAFSHREMRGLLRKNDNTWMSIRSKRDDVIEVFDPANGSMQKYTLAEMEREFPGTSVISLAPVVVAR